VLRGSPRKMFSESLYEGKGGGRFKDLGRAWRKNPSLERSLKKLLGKGYVRVSGEQVPPDRRRSEKAGEIYFLHKQVDRSSELLRP